MTYDLNAHRQKLREQMFDPLWKLAVEEGGYGDTTSKERKRIRQRARCRVYNYLKAHLGLTEEECKLSTFSREQCDAAWKVLKGITYADIRAWAKDNERRAA